LLSGLWKALFRNKNMNQSQYIGMCVYFSVTLEQFIRVNSFLLLRTYPEGVEHMYNRQREFASKFVDSHPV